MDGDALADLSDHETRNRAWWNGDAPRWVAAAERNWAEGSEPHWGIWHVPEASLDALPMGLDGVDGLDVVELGCGTAYWSAWLARRGARPVGVDLSEGQLATARAMQARFGPSFPLVHASAEDVSVLDDASFDLAFSEYGASLWCEPRAWIGEAARLLRPGGWLVFLTGSVLAALTAPPVLAPLAEALLRPMAAIRRLEWDDDPSVEFHLPHGEMMGLLASLGFVDVGLREVYAPEDGGDPDEFRHFATRGWSRKWPVEEVWVARKG